MRKLKNNNFNSDFQSSIVTAYRNLYEPAGTEKKKIFKLGANFTCVHAILKCRTCSFLNVLIYFICVQCVHFYEKRFFMHAAVVESVT